MLLRSFNLNIYAVIYANIFFALIVSILNALSIKRYLSYRQEILKSFIIPSLASIIMAFAAFALYSFFHLFAGNTISTMIAIFVGIVLYGVGLVAFHGITMDELASMPKGKSIIRIFRRLGLLH